VTILVATGLHKEAGILRRPGVVVVAGGGDGERLERELEAAAEGVTAILSCGLAGALAPGLKAGDLVIGSLSQREREGAHAEGMGRVRVTGESESPNHPHPSAASRLQHRVNSAPRYSDHAGGMIDPTLSPAGRGDTALVEMLAIKFPGVQVGTIIGSDTIIATAAPKTAPKTTRRG
jgi:nucleoside phosphorylase